MCVCKGNDLLWSSVSLALNSFQVFSIRELLVHFWGSVCYITVWFFRFKYKYTNTHTHIYFRSCINVNCIKLICHGFSIECFQFSIHNLLVFCKFYCIFTIWCKCSFLVIFCPAMNHHVYFGILSQYLNLLSYFPGNLADFLQFKSFSPLYFLATVISARLIKFWKLHFFLMKFPFYYSFTSH